MEKKTFKDFHNDLSWSTRIYTLLVVLTVVLSYVFDAWSGNWALTIVAALAAILFVETFAIYFKKHPKIWRSIRIILILILLMLLLIGATGCEHAKPITESSVTVKENLKGRPLKNKMHLSDTVQFVISVKEDVKIKDYFKFIDEQIAAYDSLVPYDLTEHLLINANPKVIDSLAATDYYTRIDRGEFVYDQRELVLLRKGDRLLVPAKNWATRLIAEQNQRSIDVNIPEFTLRILENGKEVDRFSVRVGQDKEKYLETSGRIDDLRTRTGKGVIFKIKKDPTYMNPVDGHVYKRTKRDDGRYTKLPQIPFLHTEIDGHRWGQLIHPTTNSRTLGKAYSNGCIGTGEGDAWRIYYHAPVGTEINIRYDLQGINEDGDTMILKDVYSEIL